MTDNSKQVDYYAIIDEFSPDWLAAPFGVFRMVKTAKTLVPERFDRTTKRWIVVPGLVKYTSGGETGARRISEAVARMIVDGWDGEIEPADRTPPSSVISIQALRDRNSHLGYLANPVTLTERVDELDDVAIESNGTMYHHFYPSDSPALLDAILRLEKAEGERCLVDRGLDSTLIPDKVQSARIRSIVERGDEVDFYTRFLIRWREQRRKLFRDHASKWKVRHIYSTRVFHRLVQDGIYASNDWLTSRGAAPLTDPQKVTILREVIGALRDTRFEIGLLEDKPPNQLDTIWLLKPDHAVILEIPTASGENVVYLNQEITEPETIKAFEARFEQLWNKIPEERRSEAAVITFLEEQISRVEGRTYTG